MKKEHWLYLVIAILAVWIIASYASKSDEPSDLDSDTQLAGEDSNVDEADLPASSGVTSDDDNAPQGSTSPEGSSAGPNKGTIVSVSVPTAASISVSDQAAGEMVTLGRVDMTVDGWVVVHEDRDGAPGNILGAQRFDAGSYSGGSVELLRPTVAGGKYYVMLHADDGDKMYDHTLDTTHVKNSAGMDVVMSFTAK